MEYEQDYEQIGTPTIPKRPQKKIGFAVASLVLGLVSLIFCCFCVQFLAAPLAIIFGIIALACKHSGTGMSITGIITAVLSIILTVAGLVFFSDFLPYANVIAEDFTRLIVEQDEVFPAYEADGTLPDYLLKYTETPYAEFFEQYDSSIYIIMDALNEEYKNGTLPRPDDSFIENTDSIGTTTASAAVQGIRIRFAAAG